MVDVFRDKGRIIEVNREEAKVKIQREDLIGLLKGGTGYFIDEVSTDEIDKERFEPIGHSWKGGH